MKHALLLLALLAPSVASAGRFLDEFDRRALERSSSIRGSIHLDGERAEMWGLQYGDRTFLQFRNDSGARQSCRYRRVDNVVLADCEE